MGICVFCLQDKEIVETKKDQIFQEGYPICKDCKERSKSQKQVETICPLGDPPKDFAGSTKSEPKPLRGYGLVYPEKGCGKMYSPVKNIKCKCGVQDNLCPKCQQDTKLMKAGWEMEDADSGVQAEMILRLDDVIKRIKQQFHERGGLTDGNIEA